MIKVNNKQNDKKIKYLTFLLLDFHFSQLLFNRPTNTIRFLR